MVSAVKSCLHESLSTAGMFEYLFVVGVVVLVPSVFELDSDRWVRHYWITDCVLKRGECPVGRCLSADLAVVITLYGCSSLCLRLFIKLFK